MQQTASYHVRLLCTACLSSQHAVVPVIDAGEKGWQVDPDHPLIPQWIMSHHAPKINPLHVVGS
jgi:hypothetical protein